MTAVAEKLDQKLRQWTPRTSHEVEVRVEELIASADADALDLARSRRVEQEVLDLLEESPAR